jgi:hypothetical protein
MSLSTDMQMLLAGIDRMIDELAAMRRRVGWLARLRTQQWGQGSGDIST